MNCIRTKPVGAGGCQKGTFTQPGCRRKAAFSRVIRGGRVVRLCAKCDAEIGHIIGDPVVVPAAPAGAYLPAPGADDAPLDASRPGSVMHRLTGGAA